jgi:hypothetical protein
VFAVLLHQVLRCPLYSCSGSHLLACSVATPGLNRRRLCGVVPPTSYAGSASAYWAVGAGDATCCSNPRSGLGLRCAGRRGIGGTPCCGGRVTERRAGCSMLTHPAEEPLALAAGLVTAPCRGHVAAPWTARRCAGYAGISQTSDDSACAHLQRRFRRSGCGSGGWRRCAWALARSSHLWPAQAVNLRRFL